MITAILIAATLPFAVSIIISFGPSVRATSVGGYFLYERNLDADGFVKVTVGYSLQVAAIALFFYWTFSYGVLGPLIVCFAWGAGYFAVAHALKSGKLTGFLGSARESVENPTPTIHGYIGNSVVASPLSDRRKWVIASVALASIIGLGGTMMAEVDWGVSYLSRSLGVTNLSIADNLIMAGGILAFTVLYVLWGGYRSAVATDRIQVPFAYVAFSVFIFGVAVTRGPSSGPSGLSIAILGYGAIIAVLLWRRLRLIRAVSPTDAQGRLSAFFTFLPILLLGSAALAYASGRGDTWNWSALSGVLAPDGAPVFGFPLWGLIALIVVNSIWQLIDISSLQRLQSLGDSALSINGDAPAIRILRAMGVEAAFGWALIILAAVILRSTGLTADGFIGELAVSDATSWLVPIFIFTVFVYMLSTISGFISALSYISFYDIVPILTGGSGPKISERDKILKADDVRHPRLTTIVVIALMMLFYVVLRFGVPGEQIASVLYAIYAFQIVILPSIILSIFTSWKLQPSAVIGSVIVGISMAYLTAAHPVGLVFASWLGADEVSWQVMPPLITAIVASIVFALATGFAWLLRVQRRSPDPV